MAINRVIGSEVVIKCHSAIPLSLSPFLLMIVKQFIIISRYLFYSQRMKGDSLPLHIETPMDCSFTRRMHCQQISVILSNLIRLPMFLHSKVHRLSIILFTNNVYNGLTGSRIQPIWNPVYLKPPPIAHFGLPQNQISAHGPQPSVFHVL